MRPLRLGLLALCAQACAAQAGDSLRFEEVFGETGQPSSLHYQASFGSHRMEVWRDGERQLRRQTDDSIVTYVSREADSPEFQMTVLDIPRRIVTRIDRTNLWRIGNFTDWYDLAHGIRHPLGAYQLEKSARPDTRDCAWYDLTQAGHTVHVCWNARVALPMELLGDSGQTLWRVTAWDEQPIPAATFAVQDDGYVRNDANQDMDRD